MVDRAMIEEALGQAPIEPPVTAAKPPHEADTNAAFSSKVDDWLAHVDGGRPVSAPLVDAPMSVEVSQFVPEAALQKPSVAATPPPPAPVPIPFEAPRRGKEPERYIQKLTRQWARAVAIGIAALLGLNAAIAATSYLPARFAGRVDASDVPPVPAAPAPRIRPVALPPIPDLAEPAAPAAPAATASVDAAAARYAVAVGAYSSSARAEVMVVWLRQRGFQTFTRQGRALVQVLVGPFDARDSAETALERLREAGDHADATVLPLQPAVN
jgi:hypothetical protein